MGRSALSAARLHAAAQSGDHAAHLQSEGSPRAFAQLPAEHKGRWGDLEECPAHGVCSPRQRAGGSLGGGPAGEPANNAPEGWPRTGFLVQMCGAALVDLGREFGPGHSKAAAPPAPRPASAEPLHLAFAGSTGLPACSGIAITHVIAAVCSSLWPGGLQLSHLRRCRDRWAGGRVAAICCMRWALQQQRHHSTHSTPCNTHSNEWGRCSPSPRSGPGRTGLRVYRGGSRRPRGLVQAGNWRGRRSMRRPSSAPTARLPPAPGPSSHASPPRARYCCTGRQAAGGEGRRAGERRRSGACRAQVPGSACSPAHSTPSSPDDTPPPGSSWKPEKTRARTRGGAPRSEGQPRRHRLLGLQTPPPLAPTN